MKNLSVKVKLVSAFIIVSTGALIVSVVANTLSSQVISQFKGVSDNNVPNLVEFVGMGREMVKLNVPSAKAYMSNLKKEDYIKLKEFSLEHIKDFEAHAKVYEANKFADGEEARWKEFKELRWEPYKTKTLAMLDMLIESQSPEAHAKADSIFLELEKMVHDRNAHFEELVQFQARDVQQTAQKGEALLETMKTVEMVVTGLSILASIVFGLVLSSLFVKELTRISTDISGGATQVSDAAEQISQSAQALSSSATQAAASLEESVASVEEITSMIKMNSDRSQEGRSLSLSSVDTASKAEAAGKELVDAIQSLDQSSKKIEEIVNIIDDIAFQTNLLALNASVEAARAGEQGKGFAVVAEAVRSLAHRSSVSAKDIASLIKDSSEKTHRGVRLAEANRKALEQVIDGVKKVATITEEVSAANSEISNGIGQISTAMNQLDQVTQQNAAVAEEAAATSEELSAQSLNLKHSGATLSGFISGDKMAA